MLPRLGGREAQVPDEAVHARRRRTACAAAAPSKAATSRGSTSGSGGSSLAKRRTSAPWASRISSVTGAPARLAADVVEDRAVRRVLPRRLLGRERRVGVACSTRAAPGVLRARRERLRRRGASCASICRSGVMSSRIQKPRPCVPTTRSSPWTTRSRIDVAGMFRRSDCQSSPSSKETQTSRSVPA